MAREQANPAKVSETRDASFTAGANPDLGEDAGIAANDASDAHDASDAGGAGSEPARDGGPPLLDAGADASPADLCPATSVKTSPALCGCDVPDIDSDGDSIPDCHDACPSDRHKVALGVCGCGEEERDRDEDGVMDCVDGCPRDPNKADAGACGCSKPDVDKDGNGTPDCVDGARVEGPRRR